MAKLHFIISDGDFTLSLESVAKRNSPTINNMFDKNRNVLKKKPLHLPIINRVDALREKNKLATNI